MKLGIVLAGVLRAKIDYAELCAWAADNGYGAVDVPNDRDDAVDVARRAGLEVAAINAGASLIVADDLEREKNVAAVIARVAQAARQKIPFVQLGHARIPDPSVVPWGAPDEETLRCARLGLEIQLAQISCELRREAVFGGEPKMTVIMGHHEAEGRTA